MNNDLACRVARLEVAIDKLQRRQESHDTSIALIEDALSTIEAAQADQPPVVLIAEGVR